MDLKSLTEANLLVVARKIWSVESLEALTVFLPCDES